MFDQPHIGIRKDITLPFATIIKGNFFCLASDAAHTSAILAFKTRFYGCHAAKGGSDGAKNRDSAIIVQKEQKGPAHAEGSRELRCKEHEVERGFEDVATG